MSTWAIVPVKAFGRAKSRLSNLDPDVRSELARRMLGRILAALAGSTEVHRCLVATDCPEVVESMRRAGHAVQNDLPSERLGDILDRALRRAAEEGATRAVIVMGDLPLIESEDIDALCAMLAGADAAIAPDREDAGTNALALRLPAPVPTSFGNADSFARHLASLETAGAHVAIARIPALAFDVDLPGDLESVTPELLARRSA